MEKKSLSVLVVDDEIMIQNLMLCSIKGLGHLVEAVGSSKEAFLKLSQGKFDIAFMDVNLPDGNGVELMKQTKTLYPEVGVVAMTGGVSRDEEIKIREQRVIFFLIKPFENREIQAILDHVAKRKETVFNTEKIKFVCDSPILEM